MNNLYESYFEFRIISQSRVNELLKKLKFETPLAEC